ncbi:putative disease resistance protein [Neofusicoccum parvum UCRNP2]|uniref:Putative gamma-glutamylcyclotransferase n=1 Tax=Botryosphaeria parva (strain UCR-NP2) TaxID=1287680 RepID=R1GYQ0_BOTPV|nr:putative disease resistance protein [Neofusicoccum parvum UCRNP2]
MGDRTAFFYGTLMVPQVMYRVIYNSSDPQPWQKTLTTAKPAFLPGYQRRKVRQADYPGIIPVATDSSSPSSSVRGTLVTGLTEGDIFRLDTFEGDEYERRRVPVRVVTAGRVDATDVPGGVFAPTETEEVVAETYVWTAGEDRLEPGEWDFDEFVREKLRRWVGAGADHEYAEVDATVAAELDGTGGRGANGHIGRALEADHRATAEALN